MDKSKRKRTHRDMRHSFARRLTRGVGPCEVINVMTENTHDGVISRMKRISVGGSAIVLDMGGLSHSDQYKLAIDVRKQINRDIRTRVVVKDGPFDISALKLQEFIRMEK